MHVIAAVFVGLFAQMGPRPNTDIKMADPVVKSAEGKVDKMIVKRYLRRDLPKYRYCYEKARTTDPSLRGTLIVQFHVKTDGTLTSVRVEGIHDDVENCVAGFLRRLQLPTLPEEADVRAKIQLKPAPPRRGRPGYGCGGLNCGTLGSCGPRGSGSSCWQAAATRG